MELSPRQKRLTLIRWLWLVPTAILVWYAMLSLGLALDSLAMKFCPANQQLSGFCIASWFPSVQRSIVVGCAGLSGFAIVLASALVAPAYRVRAAMVMYAVGALVALNMAMQTSAHAEFVAALIGGLLATLVAARLPQSAEL